MFITEVVLSAFNLSWRMDWLRVDMRASKDDRLTVFFTPLNPFGRDSDEEEPRDDNTIPQKAHHSHWKRHQDAVCRVKIVPSTRTRIAILAHEDTRNHCTQSCASRLHQQSYFSRRRSNCSKGSRLHDQRQKSHSKAIGNRSRRAQGNLRTTGRWWVMSEATQQMGVSREAILQNEAKMNEINEKLKKLKVGSCTKSIRNDLSKGTIVFSVESRDAVGEMGNMQLIQLKQTSATIQCLSCLTHVWEGVNVNVVSGFDPIKAQWTESEKPWQRWRFLLTTVPEMSFQEEWKMVTILAKKIFTKPWMQKEEYRNAANAPLYWTNGEKTKYTERLR